MALTITVVIPITTVVKPAIVSRYGYGGKQLSGVTPTKLFVLQVAKARDAIGFNEGAIGVEAGAESRTQIATARSRENPLQWDFVAAVAEILCRRYHVRREWLLWGEGEMIDADRGGIIRVGAAADNVDPKPIRRRKRASETEGPPDSVPGAGKNRRRAHAPTASKINHR